ncbi:fructosamine kinase family protein [Aequorivita sp. F47161]|uniref:Fructosamine kinase family protein n=1 Tax=Aequorivita vitellina TaxID=2874475 RepID=A0A9X1QU40_9FLAO|nr:fructosamine kinase family protein [Aequorivita vitellina]MCG2419501.1 fructosamine kinase family protein [Aequorivita vitellina]
MFSLLQKIASKHNFQLIEEKPLFGGDINQVFLLKCAEGNFVAKINNVSKFPGMFAAEAKGLSLLKSSKSFKIPEILGIGTIENSSYLLMEYMPTGQPNKDFWKVFAENLASLHKTTNDNFGLDHDNYIGSLPQQNDWCNAASEFYITQRLEPQFKMAADKGFHFKKLDVFFKNISEEIPNEPPSLIHGDLWNGNSIISEIGEAVLIDPAVAFAPREMDIAMMNLFGGFSEEVFSNYNAVFPLSKGWKQRIPLWQLYYLLVHLNLFGSGYLQQVQSNISKYS